MRFALALILLAGCSSDADHSRDAWLQHQPSAWSLTSAGHVRDAGPFGSVAAGWTDDAQIDAAIDAGYQRFLDRLGFAAPETPVTLNDDYVMWVPGSGWAAGVSINGSGNVGVTLWTRIESPADPGPAWIVRPPGNSWGVEYTVWRHTGAPLAPAVAHELLHVVIGDPDHQSPLWAKLN